MGGLPGREYPNTIEQFIVELHAYIFWFNQAPIRMALAGKSPADHNKVSSIPKREVFKKMKHLERLSGSGFDTATPMPWQIASHRLEDIQC